MAAAVILSLLAARAAVPVKLIVDTDIGGGGCRDVDDVVAVCIANAMVDNGEAELLAVVQNTQPPQLAGVISVLNHYYGRDAVPIGAYRGADLTPNPGTLVDPNPLPYVETVLTNFPSPIRNTSQCGDAVDLYRKTLAAQPDRSVAISSIGLSTNLAALLRSKPDAHSPLDGESLVAQKVALVAAMAGNYPATPSPQHCECNMCAIYNQGHDHVTASAASAYIVEHMPPSVKLIFSGAEVGSRVFSGGALSTCAPVSNPCRAAMIAYEGGEGKDRFSWDPLTTLVAVRGAQAGFTHECTDCDGKNIVDPVTGANQWVKGPKTNQTYLVLDDADKAGAAIDALLCQPPKNAPSPGPSPPLPGWSFQQGANCYGKRGDLPAHGATDLEHPASASAGIMTIGACEGLCLATAGCDAVTVHMTESGLYNCYRKGSVQIKQCQHGSSFDTFLRPGL